MDINQVKTDVGDWILNWVSVYNSKMQAVPCPFAKRAYMDGKIDWALASNKDELASMLEKFELTNEVVIIAIDPEKVEPSTFSSIVRNANKKLMERGLVALEDHPTDAEIVNGEIMNQGTYALVLLQELSKLNAASEALRKQGYYKTWSEDNLNDVVKWRFESPGQ